MKGVIIGLSVFQAMMAGLFLSTGDYGKMSLNVLCLGLNLLSWNLFKRGEAKK